MSIWLFSELLIVAVLSFYAFLRIKHVKIYLRYFIFFVFIVSIVLLNIIFRDYEVLKIIIYFYVIFLCYTFPVQAARLLFLILIVFSVSNVITDGYGKLTAVPFLLIVSLLPYMRVKIENINILLLTCIILLEITQSVLFQYRGSLILSVLFLLYIYSSHNYKKRLINVLCLFPVLYIVAMMSYILLLTYGYDVPISASNVERSSMVSWGVYNFAEYFVIGPGKDLFQISGGDVKSEFLSTNTIPNDPHSFIVSMFVLGGALLSISWYVFFIFKVFKINKIILVTWHHYLCIAFPLFIVFSMYPFNSYSRMVTAVLFGLILSLPKWGYCRSDRHLTVPKRAKH